MQNHEQEYETNSWLVLIVFAGILSILILCLYFLTTYFQDARKRELLSSKSEHKNTFLPNISQNSNISPESKKLWRLMFATEYQKVGKDGFSPTFNDTLSQLAGTEVLLQGFMYPLNESPKQSHFMLSYYPVQACFFCGMAGPESVVEVNAQKAFVQSNQLVAVKGKLKLNSEDPNKLFYSLEQAQPSE